MSSIMKKSSNGTSGSNHKQSKSVGFQDDNEHLPQQRRKKRPRMERPNPDEEDDVDDWEEEEDEDLPSERELLRAKRNRRLKRTGDDNDADFLGEETRVDDTTSLLNDEKKKIPVEPFNMDAEQTDGTGYFDGDTYVFRRSGSKDEEPDAWLESIDESKETTTFPKPNNTKKDDKMDDWTREELYARILPLVSDTETVLQALVRYGNLMDRHKKKNNHDGGVPEGTKLALVALNDLTEASNALLLQGDVDIYQKTRQDIMKMLQDAADDNDEDEGKKKKDPPVKVETKWEYQGNDDGLIHGPFSSQQMLTWTKSGYFVGSSRVRIRTVQEIPVPSTERSTKDELLSDLMDDDDDDDGDDGNKNDTSAPTIRLVQGKWVLSDKVDFAKYL